MAKSRLTTGDTSGHKASNRVLEQHPAIKMNRPGFVGGSAIECFGAESF